MRLSVGVMARMSTPSQEREVTKEMLDQLVRVPWEELFVLVSTDIHTLAAEPRQG